MRPTQRCMTVSAQEVMQEEDSVKEEIKALIKDGEIFIEPGNEMLQYSGRISYNEEGEPELVYPCSYVKWHFRGTVSAIIVSSKKYYQNVYAGAIVDANQVSMRLKDDGIQRIDFGEPVSTDHIVTFFKRQDACNTLTIHGIVLSAGSELTACPERPERRIEVYGDSVSAGEVSEAVFYIGQPDPADHEGCYSNSWYSYPWILARNLKAELHNISQGGIALMPGTGWFNAPELTGLEQIYDKVKYYPDAAAATGWDFGKYTPQVVIVAVGQNDANPDNFMRDDYEGEKASEWRARYKEFLRKLRGVYPQALIICATTILNHDEAWDRAIDEAVMSVNGGIAQNETGSLDEPEKRVRHFTYRLNGRGTPGHIRIPEAEMMAVELGRYIESFGTEIWNF